MLLFLNSCQSDNETPIQAKIDSHLISQENAIIVAENLMAGGKISSKFSKGSKIKKANNVFVMFTTKKDAAFYIINYENGGFAIISADDRNTPVLAYSENSTFDNNQAKYPEGLKMWLSLQTANIEHIKIKNEDQTDIHKTEWSVASKIITANLTGKIPPDDPTSCPNGVTETVGPLLTTTWGQWGGYNDLIDEFCSNNSTGRVPTGCVATAMAQVMKYYQRPLTYNWANMPNTYGTINTAGLMLDIGNAVDMDYGCDGSSAKSEEKIVPAFIDSFHYSNAADADYDYSTVIANINARKPVILTGGRKKDGVSINMYTDGHAWVCDGYMRQSVYSYDPTRGGCNGAVILQLHMNWGWSSLYDGWYALNNFNPGNSTYNYQPRMYYNITP
ncbi:C10 family peptidase [Flavobacterium sp. LHD-80]|uniref:C10 family peptidase n=1 Tax=Flavobacterium sp. LHD-80 TaxID=3071411 RepID=UPI0027E13AB4|nr:C10 family peptidase [Flavobacterium sp. LHD-80]MDQ6472372.1 C10 family peptidase [Flavobacterium sp. LHD-80]